MVFVRTCYMFTNFSNGLPITLANIGSAFQSYVTESAITVSRLISHTTYGPLTRYVKLRVACVPGMPWTFSPPPTSKETASQRPQHASRHVRDARAVMHLCEARAVMHVGIANPPPDKKRSRHSRRMHNPQFYVSGMGPFESFGIR